MPESGHLMNRSAEYLSLEPLELRGHRIGLVPQRFAVRGDLSPLRNLVYAMDASNRNFLKPKPVLAANCCWRPDWTKRCWTTASIP